MLRKTLFLSALACLVASCANDALKSEIVESDVETPAGSLVVSFVGEDGPLTKAAINDAYTYETQINKAQVLVFNNADGLLAAYKSNTDGSKISVDVSQGKTYRIYAVINGADLSDVKKVSDLTDKTTVLSDNSTTATTGFVLVGDALASLEGQKKEVTITVSRLAARVSLGLVKNSLPAGFDSLVVKNVFLANVMGTYNYGGSLAPATMYFINKDGRADEQSRNATHIIGTGSYEASAKELTFKAVNSKVLNGASYSTPVHLYSYPNNATTQPAGYQETFALVKTVLVVAADVAGSIYYYPVVLPELKRNNAYTVELTITGLGNNDPTLPVTKGALEATVSIKEWDNNNGNNLIEENI